MSTNIEHMTWAPRSPTMSSTTSPCRSVVSSCGRPRLCRKDLLLRRQHRGLALREGHYLRHLRRTRRLYSERRRCLLETLRRLGIDTAVPAALFVVVFLPDGFDDQSFTVEAQAADLGAAPLSPWFAAATRSHSGLLLGVANVLDRRIERDLPPIVGDDR